MKIKKGDNVKIIKGKDRGKTGKVTKANPQTDKILVEGLNLYKKHVKPKNQNEKGQIVLVPRPIAISNVMLVCKACNNAVRVGYEIHDKNKVRYCKRCKAPQD